MTSMLKEFPETNQMFNEESIDSLDNIVVAEDEMNKFDEPNSMDASMNHSQDPQMDDDIEHPQQLNLKMESIDSFLEQDLQEEPELNQINNPFKNTDQTQVENPMNTNDSIETSTQNLITPPSSSSILKKISLKRRSIFSLISRADYKQQQLKNLIGSSKQIQFQSQQQTPHSQQQLKSQELGSSSSSQVPSNKSAEQDDNKEKPAVPAQTFMKREILNYSRREKSLEELSKKFLSLFLDKEESMLSLDKITNQLGVERRRIYDIINILESLQLVSRKGKNNYQWNGFSKIYITINQYDSPTYRKQSHQFEVEIVDECLDDEDDDEEVGNGKREKSLEMLSIGFLKLFLHWKRTMTLEEAARKLSSKNIDHHKIKTKIRRLYDIANVFKSLGLIKKTSLIDTKKPAFQWIGLNGLDSFADRILLDKKQSIEINNESDEDLELDQHLNIPVIQRAQSEDNQAIGVEPSLKKKRCTRPQLRKSYILQQQIKEEKARQQSKQQSDSPFEMFQQNQNSIDENTNFMANFIHENANNSNQSFNNFLNYSNMQSRQNEQLQQQQQQQQQQYPQQQQRPENLFDVLASAMQGNLNLAQIASFQQNSNVVNQLMAKCLQMMINGYVNKMFSTQSFTEPTEESNKQTANSLFDFSKMLAVFHSQTLMAAMQCSQNFEESAQMSQQEQFHDENINIAAQNNYQQNDSNYNQQMKNPILKKTFAIIQPKADERACLPTPPTKKRKEFQPANGLPHLACNEQNPLINNHHSSHQTNEASATSIGLLSDKTNQMNFSDRTHQSAVNQHSTSQASSFKKIRRLTFESHSPLQQLEPKEVAGNLFDQLNQFELKKAFSMDAAADFCDQNEQDVKKEDLNDYSVQECL